MHRRVAETLSATAEVRLEEVGPRVPAGSTHIIYEGVGRHGGLEAAGDLRRIVDLQRL